MQIKLDPDGLKCEAGVSDRQIGAGASDEPTSSGASAFALAAGQAKLREVIQLAMAGTLPLDRPLETNEPKKFHAKHINLVLDRGMGLTAAEIAEKHDMHQMYVARLLVHPYAQAILTQMLGNAADKMTEPMERLKAYAHEMIDVKIALVRSNIKDTLKNQIASDILDRAGFGARIKVETDNVHRFSLAKEHSQRLLNALDEADRVEDVDYARYVENPSQVSEADSGLSGGLEQPVPVSGACHGALPADEPLERSA